MRTKIFLFFLSSGSGGKISEKIGNWTHWKKKTLFSHEIENKNDLTFSSLMIANKEQTFLMEKPSIH